LFRKIDGKPNWTNFKEGIPDWLDTEDVPGDLLRDLRTTGNDLSVYAVDDNQSNLDKII